MFRRTTEIEAPATAGEGRLQTGPVRNWATYDGLKCAPHGSVELRGEMVMRVRAYVCVRVCV